MQVKATWDDKRFGGNYYQAVHVELVDDNGIHTAKYVDNAHFLEAVSGSMVTEDVFCRIGKIPQYYYDGAIRREADETISGKIMLIAPKTKTVVQFEKTRYEIPFPALLFFYTIKSGKICTTEVYALKGRRWGQKSFLYNYPFGNVHIHSHTVCWGNNVLPKIDDLQKLDIICSLFYTSPCNNDLYVAGQSTVWMIANLRDMFEKLKEKSNFPEEILVKSNKGTIGSLWMDF